MYILLEKGVYTLRIVVNAQIIGFQYRMLVT